MAGAIWETGLARIFLQFEGHAYIAVIGSGLAVEGQEVLDLFRALGHVGTVKAVRQEYQVYRTVSGEFVVLSPSNRGISSFHMTLVNSEKVEALGKIVTREGATSGSLMKDKRIAEVFGGREKAGLRFDLLMALYVLTAQERVEMRKSGRNLVFTLKKADL